MERVVQFEGKWSTALEFASQYLSINKIILKQNIHHAA
jgi:hypothetical protein